MQSIRGYACIDAISGDDDDDDEHVKVYSVDMYRLCHDDVSERSALKSCLSAV